MANMFSGNIQKEMPKNMDDCIKPDSVSTNLWIWCERLEKWGKILFWILLIGGLILAISGSIVEKEVVTKEATYWSEVETEIRKTFEFENFFSLLLDTALYAFLEYCTYHIIALLIGALASLVQNTKISANVALYNTTYNSINKAINNTIDSCEEQKTDNNEKSEVHQWRCDNCDNLISQDPCPNCGFSTRHQESHKRPEIMQKLFNDSNKNNDLIICEECGTENPRGQRACRNCHKPL